MTVIGFLWSIPVPAAIAAVSPWLNWATISVALAIVYYLTLSFPLGSAPPSGSSRCSALLAGSTRSRGRYG